jgi:hypothetical protein
MNPTTFREAFEKAFDKKADGLLLSIMPPLRVTTMIMETLLEVQAELELKIDTLNLEQKEDSYSLTVNGDINVVMQVEKRKEAVNG